MSLTITVTDNGDDTGAVATVAGSTALTTNTIYTQRIDGELGATWNTWTNTESRIGDGSVALDLAAGHYFVHVSNLNGSTTTVSPVQYATVTTGEESIHYRCALAAQSRIRLIGLDGMDEDNVIVRKVPTDRDTARPCVLLSTFGTETQPPTAGTNIRDDVGYPVLCSFVFADQHTVQQNHNKLLKWREQINRAFHNQRLPGVSEIIYGVVQPAQIVDLPAWLIGKFHSSMILRFTSRHSRGI